MLGGPFLLGLRLSCQLTLAPPIPSHWPRPPLLQTRYLLQREVWYGVLITLFYGLPAESDVDGAGVDEPWNPPANTDCSDRSTESHTQGPREQGVV